MMQPDPDAVDIRLIFIMRVLVLCGWISPN